MKKFKLPWINNKKESQPIGLMERDKVIDPKILSADIKATNITLSGKLLYKSDIYNTIALFEKRKIEYSGKTFNKLDLKSLETLCKNTKDGYSFVDLVMLLTIPKSDNTDLFKLFSTTPELRIVYSEKYTHTYILLGGTIQGFKNLILNTKLQTNNVLTIIKNVLYESQFNWAFIDLINLGLMEDYFIVPGTDCFWDNSDSELNIDDESLNSNIEKRIEHSIIHDLEYIDFQYADDQHNFNMTTLYNMPNVYDIYLQSLKRLRFHIYDIIKVFGFNYILDEYTIMKYTNIYDILSKRNMKYYPEHIIVNNLIKNESLIRLIFGDNSSDLDMVLMPSYLRSTELVEIDELLEEEVAEEDISDVDDLEKVIIDEDVEVLSGDMPIPKFDIDRYKETRLSEDTEEDSGKYDI